MRPPITIVQEFKGPKDLISEICLGRFDIEMTRRPAVYCRKYQGCLLLAIYHHEDWSEAIEPIRTFDSHRHDLEGAVLGPDFTAAIYHHEVKVIHQRVNTLFIQAHGHGISFNRQSSGNSMVYTDYKMIDMSEGTPVHDWLLHTVRPVFRRYGVNIPQEWDHGGFWNDPTFYAGQPENL